MFITNMRRNSLILSILLAGGVFLSPSMAEDKVVATVNGKPITQSEIALAMEDMEGETPASITEKMRSDALDFMINVKLIAEKAKSEKKSDSAGYKQRLAYAQDRILMQLVLQDLNNAAKDDNAAKKFYEQQVSALKPMEEIRARHILVENEDDAKKIHVRLKAGEDFGAIAKELSKDPGSAVNGGDLGFFIKEQMVPEFASAAMALKPGELSEPVKSQFGWHIIKLEEKRNRPLPSFEDVKERVYQTLARNAESELIEKIRKDAKIEIKKEDVVNKAPDVAPSKTDAKTDKK